MEGEKGYIIIYQAPCESCENTVEDVNPSSAFQAYCAPVEPATLLKLTEALTRLGTEQLPLDFKFAPFSTTNRAAVTPRGNTGRTRQTHLLGG